MPDSSVQESLRQKRKRSWVYFLTALFLVFIALPAFVYYQWSSPRILGSINKSGRIYTGDFNNRLITRPGVYPLPPDFQLQVRIIETAIVDFRITAKGESALKRVTVLRSSKDRRFSHAMRWALLWESQESRLWVMSSDIGSHVYGKQPDGGYKITYLEDAPAMVSQMPKAIFDYHSDSDKTEWAQYRDQQ